MTVVRAVHQFHPHIVYGDAVSNECFGLQRLFWSREASSGIFTASAEPDVEAFVRPHRDLARAATAEAVVLIHHSLGSDVLDDVLDGRGRKALVYHNITPASYFAGVDEYRRRHAELGRKQLARLAAECEVGIAHSEFNQKELLDAGFRRTAVVPVFVDWAQLDVEPDRALSARLADGRTNIITVGQLLPHKSIHDVIRGFAAYRTLDPSARLVVVGAAALPSYRDALLATVRELGLEGSVLFTGRVTQEELVACYAKAAAFVSLSEHEGFCVPLLEAMHFRVPIVAYAAAAIPETLGDAGLLVAERSPAHVADALERAVRDDRVRADLVARMAGRLETFRPERIEAALRQALAAVGIALPAARRRVFVVVAPARNGAAAMQGAAVAAGLEAAGHAVRPETSLPPDVARARPDAVIVQEDLGAAARPGAIRALLALRRSGTPVVLGLHRVEPDRFGNVRALARAIRHRRSELAKLPLIAAGAFVETPGFIAYVTSIVLLAAATTRVVTHSERMRRWFGAIVRDPARLEAVPILAVPLGDWSASRVDRRERVGVPVEPFLFVVLGRFRLSSRLVEVVDALPAGAVAIVAGASSDPAYLARVRQAAEAREPAVLVRVDPDNIEPMLSAADALVVWSSDGSGDEFAARAMAAEVPCVLTDRPSLYAYQGAALFAGDRAELRVALDEVRRPERHEHLRRRARMLRRLLAAERNAIRYVAGLRLGPAQ